MMHPLLKEFYFLMKKTIGKWITKTWSSVVVVSKIWNLRNLKNLFRKELEIKPYGLGSRVRDVEAFQYKTEIKMIYFVHFLP